MTVEGTDLDPGLEPAQEPAQEPGQDSGVSRRGVLRVGAGGVAVAGAGSLGIGAITASDTSAVTPKPGVLDLYTVSYTHLTLPTIYSV